MNDLIKTIKQADPATLWALVSDVSQIMENRQYKPEWNNTPFLVWYEFYKLLEAEIDRKLVLEDMEG